MILSMTGYASVSREIAQGSLALEIKSVNSRFLDIVFRMNDEMRSSEPMLRERVVAAVTRGKVEVRVGIGRDSAGGPSRGTRPLAVNRDAVRRLTDAAAEIRGLAPQASELRMIEILNWPGVLEDAGVAPDAMRDMVAALAVEALAEFTASRRREGEKLRDMLIARIDAIAHWVSRIEPLLPQIVADHHARLAARLRDALGAADDERIRQEVALFGIKIDVAEELSRLGAHLGEVRRVLDGSGASGKRLDFLMQELNREANTLGSKSVSSDVSAAALEIKVLIEQMREQVQNIE